MSQFHSPLAAIPCRIGRSALPDERAFEVRTFDGGRHTGSGPAHYFWAEGKPIGAGSPPGGQDLQGLVAAQVLKAEGARALVEVPDGSVAWVEAASVVRRPTGIDLGVIARIE